MNEYRTISEVTRDTQHQIWPQYLIHLGAMYSDNTKESEAKTGFTPQVIKDLGLFFGYSEDQQIFIDTVGKINQTNYIQECLSGSSELEAFIGIRYSTLYNISDIAEKLGGPSVTNRMFYVRDDGRLGGLTIFYDKIKGGIYFSIVEYNENPTSHNDAKITYVFPRSEDSYPEIINYDIFNTVKDKNEILNFLQEKLGKANLNPLIEYYIDNPHFLYKNFQQTDAEKKFRYSAEKGITNVNGTQVPMRRLDPGKLKAEITNLEQNKLNNLFLLLIKYQIDHPLVLTAIDQLLYESSKQSLDNASGSDDIIGTDDILELIDQKIAQQFFANHYEQVDLVQIIANVKKMECDFEEKISQIQQEQVDEEELQQLKYSQYSRVQRHLEGILVKLSSMAIILQAFDHILNYSGENRNIILQLKYTVDYNQINNTESLDEQLCAFKNKFNAALPQLLKQEDEFTRQFIQQVQSAITIIELQQGEQELRSIGINSSNLNQQQNKAKVLLAKVQIYKQLEALNNRTQILASQFPEKEYPLVNEAMMSFEGKHASKKVYLDTQLNKQIHPLEQIERKKRRTSLAIGIPSGILIGGAVGSLILPGIGTLIGALCGGALLGLVAIGINKINFNKVDLPIIEENSIAATPQEVSVEMPQDRLIQNNTVHIKHDKDTDKINAIQDEEEEKESIEKNQSNNFTFFTKSTAEVEQQPQDHNQTAHRLKK